MNVIKTLWKKHKDFVLYILFGICTTLVNVAAYWALSHAAHIPMMASTVTAWALAVLFAYLTNRKWVFHSEAQGKTEIAKEVLAFFACRLATGVIDWLCMFVFVDLWNWNDMLVKFAANILVIILNFIASKFAIFRKKDVPRISEVGGVKHLPLLDVQDSRFYVNVARGIAVFLMLWGHCIQYCCAGSFDFFENAVFRVIYSFHMPLFAILSGYLFFFSFQKRNLGELVVHRTQALLQPIVMCGILHFFLTEAAAEWNDGNRDIVFNGNWLSHMDVFWFLWSMLAGAIAVAISCKITKRLELQLLLLIVGSGFVMLFPNAENNVYMYPYFVLGFLFARFRKQQWLKTLCRFRYVSIAGFPVMMLFFKKEHYIYTSGMRGREGLLRHMPVNLFRWAIGLAGCIFALTLLKLLCDALRRLGHAKVKDRGITRFFVKAGENSLQIYTLSCIFLSVYLPLIYDRFVEAVGRNVFAANMAVYNFIFTPILAVLYSIGLQVLVWILKKVHIHKVLFGK